MACLESEAQMTATPEEIEEGRQEGVILHAAHSFLRILGTDKAEGVEIQKIDKFYFDENKKAVIELVEGSSQVIAVDQVIFAVFGPQIPVSVPGKEKSLLPLKVSR